ncbi:MAG: 3'(2'),5'-bisphosphate nucleotidase CysQ [Bacteroidales bacterium]|nr:3'(2'),5'-bisphosphate nucleotidase CysQ [Bacteroidales bacterium]MCF8343870.1 3'(2'),5'-bisphosphate nucleotidase CysQ [Bacteroidales bacterium]MCF8351884.1 3'(2'),5'-bisphosphate nucleotidase CysQ [Bacteroidales bacterium]MCF8375257.1 3'(2'),5'-bisphosphate nucleotidase CysQ [Bacteroidales bacterium]MCF8400281.1 3'(2'),5'-bisphosphate nucleotidase CysQ [Bacteroidales bacterium]
MNWKEIDLIPVVRTSIHAGHAIKEIYNTGFSVETKQDNSPITMADRKSHEIIIQYLNETGIPVMSEEGIDIPYEERKAWALYWLVDPLDGTKEFIKKNDEFTVNIALIKNQKPVMGVIYVPVLDILYFAGKELGAFRLDHASNAITKQETLETLSGKATKLPTNDPPDVFTIVASRSHMSEETKEFIGKLEKKHGEIKMMSRGSSLKLCMVAEGKANIYPRFAPTSEWDTAAGQAIVECSGGQLTHINEIDPILYNKKDLLNPWFIAKR